MNCSASRRASAEEPDVDRPPRSSGCRPPPIHRRHAAQREVHGSHAEAADRRKRMGVDVERHVTTAGVLHRQGRRTACPAVRRRCRPSGSWLSHLAPLARPGTAPEEMPCATTTELAQRIVAGPSGSGRWSVTTTSGQRRVDEFHQVVGDLAREYFAVLAHVHTARWLGGCCGHTRTVPTHGAPSRSVVAVHSVRRPWARWGAAGAAGAAAVWPGMCTGRPDLRGTSRASRPASPSSPVTTRPSGRSWPASARCSSYTFTSRACRTTARCEPEVLAALTWVAASDLRHRRCHRSVNGGTLKRPPRCWRWPPAEFVALLDHDDARTAADRAGRR